MENSFNMEGGDIFNLSNDAFVNPPKKQSNALYKPEADEGREGVYKAIIRFLPWHKAPSASKIRKYYVWVNDPIDGAFSVDCPSTVGKKSILKDTYWKLKNSTSAAEQAQADNFARAENFYSLIQVVKDPNKPDLEGKIMIFKFGKKINDKIEAQLKPATEEIAPCNPYDLFEGKLFALHITKKQKWNNYDLCEFVGDKRAITLPGTTEPIKKTQEDMARVLNWLKEQSPDLGAYEYKEWTEETHSKVIKAINNILPQGRMAEEILSEAKKDRTAAPRATTSDAVNEVLNVSRPAETTAAPAATKASSNNLDDLYAGL